MAAIRLFKKCMGLDIYTCDQLKRHITFFNISSMSLATVDSIHFTIVIRTSSI